MELEERWVLHRGAGSLPDSATELLKLWPGDKSASVLEVLTEGCIPDLLTKVLDGGKGEDSDLHVILMHVQFQDAPSLARGWRIKLTRGTEPLWRVWLSPRGQVAMWAWLRLKTVGMERRK